MPRQQTSNRTGFVAALTSPLLLGLIPILAKVSFAAGVDVTTLIFIRTAFAALILWIVTLIVDRKLIVTSIPGAGSSVLIGAINGAGSVFFYASLTRIDASLGQLVNITYLVWVTLLLRLIGQRVSLLTSMRVALAVGAIYLLTSGGSGEADWIGVGMMLAGAFAYAVQLVVSQRVLLDIPAPTVTLYALTGMSLIVFVAWLLVPAEQHAISVAAWAPVLWMGVVTAGSRLALFLGVKHIGSLQTALFSMLEVLVTLVIAGVWLGEILAPTQWLGAMVIVVTVLLVKYERGLPRVVDWWTALLVRYSRQQPSLPEQIDVPSIGKLKALKRASASHIDVDSAA